jgi:hypothetical protein
MCKKLLNLKSFLTYVHFLFLLICHIAFFLKLIGCLDPMIKYDLLAEVSTLMWLVHRSAISARIAVRFVLKSHSCEPIRLQKHHWFQNEYNKVVYYWSKLRNAGNLKHGELCPWWWNSGTNVTNTFLSKTLAKRAWTIYQIIFVNLILFYYIF